MREKRTILIAGPTASGKSALALEIAERGAGEIVNADAMQVYRDLQIVTARPSAQDEATAKHHLYGVIDGEEHCSAGRWARLAGSVIKDIHARGNDAIVAGGTGLYFKALLDGLSPIPETPSGIRQAARARFEKLGASGFHAEVCGRDPQMAHLPVGDTQRLLRAWEVFETSGRALSEYQTLAREPLIKEPIEKILVLPARETLYARTDERAEKMFAAGAIYEVKKLLARNLDPQLPVMKALGVPEIAAFLGAQRTKEEALVALQQNTRRFVKRQRTWFRGQATGWPQYDAWRLALENFV